MDHSVELCMVNYHGMLAACCVCILHWLGRPTYMSADLCFTTHSFFFLSFFFSRLISRSSLNGTQPKLATCSEVTAIWKHLSKIWGIPSPFKSGAQKPLFWTTWQLNGNFNGLYLRNKTRYKQSVKPMLVWSDVRSPHKAERFIAFAQLQELAISQNKISSDFLGHGPWSTLDPPVSWTRRNIMNFGPQTVSNWTAI